jgi:phenylpyruvate tautomerase PptA (4-oxalocrotonate tautomerase family)
MPIVRITLMEGYEEDIRAELARRLTDAIRATLAAPLDGITVAVEEVKPANYMRGRVSRVPGKPQPSPAETVKAFLSAMERRDLAAAGIFLADDFRMVFPGNAEFTVLEDLVHWSGSRYRWVKKSYEAFDECFGEAETIVYCFGTLSGEWPDGTPFDGIRFLDRFTVRDGKLLDQRVWNDLALGRPSLPRETP